ncbi:hypothetical protein GCM10009848_35130 [Micromonospora lupini]
MTAPRMTPGRTLNHLADRIRNHRQQRESRWRRLNPGRQALLALAHLHNCDTYTRLTAGRRQPVPVGRPCPGSRAGPSSLPASASTWWALNGRALVRLLSIRS